MSHRLSTSGLGEEAGSVIAAQCSVGQEISDLCDMGEVCLPVILGAWECELVAFLTRFVLSGHGE